jgi:hypothetical protein
MMAVLKKLLPELVVLENIFQLADGTPSDMDLIAHDFQEMDPGYWLWFIVFDAGDHGSRATRNRVYGIACKNKTDALGELRTFAYRVLVGTQMSHNPFPLSEFIYPSHQALMKAMPPHPAFTFASKDESEKDDVGPGWRNEHNEFFRLIGKEWPPRGCHCEAWSGPTSTANRASKRTWFRPHVCFVLSDFRQVSVGSLHVSQVPFLS